MKIYTEECVLNTNTLKPVRYGYLSGIGEFQFLVTEASVLKRT